MRVLLTVALLLLFLEAVLAFACFAGWQWLGGWPWGAVLVAGVVLLLVAPWVGELRVEFDSQAGAASARLGWWGTARFTQQPQEIRARLFGIPFRLRPRPKKKQEAEPAEKTLEKPPRPTARRRGPDVQAVVRAAPAGLQLLLDLLLEAREVSVQVRAPSGVTYVDAALSGAVGRREWGPWDVTVAGTGERRVAVRYRIGLLRATLAVLYAVVQGRPWRLKQG